MKWKQTLHAESIFFSSKHIWGIFCMNKISQCCQANPVLPNAMYLFFNCKANAIKFYGMWTIFCWSCSKVTLNLFVLASAIAHQTMSQKWYCFHCEGLGSITYWTKAKPPLDEAYNFLGWPVFTKIGLHSSIGMKDLMCFSRKCNLDSSNKMSHCCTLGT